MSELAEFVEEEIPTGEAEAPEKPAETPAEPEPEAEQEPEAKQEPEAEPETSPPEGDKPVSGQVPIAALLDEREKRQKLQKQLEEYQSKQQQPAANVPDVLDDQEGFVQHMQSQISESVGRARIELSQDFMRMMHEDYEAMEAKFVEMATENPELANRMRLSPMPAKFAYETAKKAEKLAAMENVDEWESKKTAELKAQIRAELEAELTGKADATAKAANALKPSLTKQRAEGGNNVAIQDIPDPLESTFNR